MPRIMSVTIVRQIFKIVNFCPTNMLYTSKDFSDHTSQMSNIESNNSQKGGLEDYNNISDGIFPHFTTPVIKS